MRERIHAPAWSARRDSRTSVNQRDRSSWLARAGRPVQQFADAPVVSQRLPLIQQCTDDLPDDTVVIPGHGPLTTVGEERRTNPFLTGEIQMA